MTNEYYTEYTTEQISDIVVIPPIKRKQSGLMATIKRDLKQLFYGSLCVIGVSMASCMIGDSQGNDEFHDIKLSAGVAAVGICLIIVGGKGIDRA